MAKATPKTTDAASPMSENTVLTLIVKKEDHQQAYKKTLAKVAQTVALQGFRKGKAPLSLVEQTVGTDKIIERSLEELIAPLYDEAVQKAGISPLVQPKITAKKLDKDADFELEAQTAVAPEVNLGDYETTVKKASKEFAKTEREETKDKTELSKEDQEKHDEELKRAKMSFILQALIKEINPKIAPLLLEQELNHQLEQFVRHLASHKIELEHYLTHSGKTIEDIRQEYAVNALASLQVEFILQAITKELDPEIDHEEIHALMGDTSKMSDRAKARIHEEAEIVLKRRKVVEKLEALSQ